ncbi:OmpA family protein, partial [bacterium]
AFLLLGGGFAHNDFFPDARDGFAPLVDVGAGIVSAPMFGRHVHLRAEARYVHDFSEGGHGEPRLGLGIEVPLFSSRPIVTRAPAPLAPAAPAAPIALPLPAVREVVREVPRPWIDSDGDNVDDEHDRCPATPRAVRADAFGCVIANQRIELTGVEFEHNSARLTPGAQTVLDRVARSLAEIGDLKIEVAGHTDSVGQSTTNLALSSARAESVRKYLVAHGVDASRLGARGYGEYELRATPERSDADRQRNRRVELRLVETGVTR